MVKFVVTPGDGINIIYDTTNHIVNITNSCFPCGSTPTNLIGNLCITTAPGNLTGTPCDAPAGSVTYNQVIQYQMSGITGGTPPYTYDWSAFSGTATWDPSLGGTPTQTVTPSGATLTISDTLAGANASGSATYDFNITPGSFVKVSDSTTLTQDWYFNSLNTTGQCSAVHTPPGYWAALW